jgi:alpha-methylacyl-CoA racemase
MGPLHGIKVIELAGVGPVPFCAMLLADLGAEVIRVDRPPPAEGSLPDPLRRVNGRGRQSIAIDLKHPYGSEVLMRLVEGADVLIEGFRPGVAERLDIGPYDCLGRNPRLVYGRMTGWGQEGPLADRAGHDINYIALTGALDAIGEEDAPPVPPLNLVGDYGGGSMYLALGVLSALVERVNSGRGQVVDAAIVDGAASLMSLFYELRAIGLWPNGRGKNLLDGGAPFYDTYRTGDGRYVAVGALEPEFYAELLDGLGIDPEALPPQMDPRGWPEIRNRLADAFATKSRDEWTAQFADTDACVTPVLTMEEAPGHPHLQARNTFVDTGTGIAPSPAPRFSRSRPVPGRGALPPGTHTAEVLERAGFNADEIETLRELGIVN